MYLLRAIQKHKILSILITSGLVLCTSSTDVNATQLNVPGQYSSIQSAINNSRNGDVIQIGNGTYRENLVINSKYITLHGNDDRQSVVLAGNPGNTPIMIQNTPQVSGGKVIISGLKITGGYSPDGQGGGITVANNSDPEIRDNTIENNTSLSQGGGILIFNNSHPLIHDNVIQNNTAKFFGGGVFAVKYSSPTISNNTISNNRATGGSVTNGGSSGGGIYLENDTANPGNYSQPVVINNSLVNNQADFAGGAVMLRVGVNAIIENNTITTNSASYGGGIHIETSGSSPRIIGNIITGNISPKKAEYGGSGFGGGISVYDSSKPEISDNTISGNQSTSGGAGVVVAENAQIVMQRNDVYGNSVTGPGVVEGGGLYIANASGEIKNNIFRSNSAQIGGGVALLDNVGGTKIINNTIVKNNEPYLQGGAIFVRNSSGSNPYIVNNILSLNQGYQLFEQSSRSTIQNNTITASGSGMYFNYSTNGINTANSLNNSNGVNADSNNGTDPAFSDANNNNYNLTLGSASIDIGRSDYGVYDDAVKEIRSTTPDAGAHEYNTVSNKKEPVYRFWSTAYNSHFYTINKSERDFLLKSYQPTEWRYEGLGYEAFSAGNADTTPLYRFYSSLYKGHFYTASLEEKDYIISSFPTTTWQYEGVAYNVYPESSSVQSRFVYRFWSPSYRHHFYTANQSESSYIQGNYPSSIWTYEGQRFKVPL